jgi:hypothetical protein
MLAMFVLTVIFDVVWKRQRASMPSTRE